MWTFVFLKSSTEVVLINLNLIELEEWVLRANWANSHQPNQTKQIFKVVDKNQTSSNEFGDVQVIFSFSLCLLYKIFWLRLRYDTLWKTLLLTFSLHWLWTVNVWHHSVERPPQMMLKIAAWSSASLLLVFELWWMHSSVFFFFLSKLAQANTATLHWVVTLMLNVARGPLTTSTKVVSVSKTPQVLMQYMVF